MPLTPPQQTLHHRAQDLSRRHRRVEGELIEVLQEIDKSKLFKQLGRRSLFQYAVLDLDLTEPVANGFISVARKAAEIAQLKRAIAEQRISVAKATRIVSALSSENADELIQFAISHSTRETDFQVAKLRPKSAAPDRVQPLAEDVLKFQTSISRQVHTKLLRVQSLLASKRGRNVGFEDVLDAALSEYLEKHDPVRKAERAQRKNADKAAAANGPAETIAQPQKLCANRVFKRKPLNAETKHAVVARDGGRCTHVDASGNRCDSDRWLHLHHIVPVSQGGGNESENLTTLCSFHHDLVHQLSLPLDGQVSWLRSPQVAYRIPFL